MTDRSLFDPALKAACETVQNRVRHPALSGWVPLGNDEGALKTKPRASTIHDIAGDLPVEFAAFFLAGAAPAPIVWVGNRFDLYPPGLRWCALDPARIILAEAAEEADRLGALEIALRGGMHGVAMVERVSRLAARRLALAARCGGGVGLVLRSGTLNDSTAFSTRWRVNPARSGPNDATRWNVELLYARDRPPGVFLVEADRHATPPALVVVPTRHTARHQERHGSRRHVA